MMMNGKGRRKENLPSIPYASHELQRGDRQHRNDIKDQILRQTIHTKYPEDSFFG
jgi:hypothetical protein